MGSLLSTKSNSNEDEKGCYRLKAKDAEAMKKLWKMIENDPPYYGSIFSTIFFHNHPQYVKYFHDHSIPEFVEDARIKKKFSAVCSIVSELFISYSRKIHQRDHLLGYIAMIHKDMQLSSQDLKNFMTDLLEMLTEARPRDMTTECRDLIMRYFSGLLKRIEYFMEVQRENDFSMIEGLMKPRKRICGCKPHRDPPLIYGRSFEYWIANKEYWQRRLAVWSSLQKDVSKISCFAMVKKGDSKVHRLETIKYNIGKGRSNRVARARQPKTTSRPRTEATSNDEEKPNMPGNVKSSNNHGISGYSRSKKGRRRYRRNFMLSNKSKPMEAIPEVLSRALIDPTTPSRHKNSVRKTQAFRDAVEALNTTRIHSEADEIFSGSAIKRKTIIDTARARKRGRDKRLNAIYSTIELKNVEGNDYKRSSATVSTLQSMNLETLMTSQAGKFADVLTKRVTQ